jgi:hypothetical protein
MQKQKQSLDDMLDELEVYYQNEQDFNPNDAVIGKQIKTDDLLL